MKRPLPNGLNARRDAYALQFFTVTESVITDLDQTLRKINTAEVAGQKSPFAYCADMIGKLDVCQRC